MMTKSVLKAAKVTRSITSVGCVVSALTWTISCARLAQSLIQSVPTSSDSRRRRLWLFSSVLIHVTVMSKMMMMRIESPAAASNTLSRKTNLILAPWLSPKTNLRLSNPIQSLIERMRVRGLSANQWLAALLKVMTKTVSIRTPSTLHSEWSSQFLIVNYFGNSCSFCYKREAHMSWLLCLISYRALEMAVIDQYF